MLFEFKRICLMFNYSKRLIPLVVLLVTACSNKQLYEATQQNRQLNCQSLPPSERQQCFDDLNKKTHDEYEEARQSF